LEPISNLIDTLHLGNGRVIAAWETDGLIVDPGPESCIETLLAGLEQEPRALLLTHIHLDHAGASGALVERFPDLRVYVHEVGAPHMIDPSRLMASATRLYGDEMDRLWGEMIPIPSERVVALRGGETVEGFKVLATPGHASHHVSYLDLDEGTAYVGDVGGARIPPSEVVLLPTPPPDIDLEAWQRSLDQIAEHNPQRLRLTHFGEVSDAAAHIDLVRERMQVAADLSRPLDRDAFVAAIEQEISSGGDAETASRYRQATPPEQLWLGLERYWRQRAESAEG
jgi:glyoxylase-like metal-dependent hydrolase (beta-lactamase superfamily II)